MDYALHVLTLIAIYTVLAVSLDLLVGHTGLLSMAHASFYGLGAYSSAILSVQLGMPFLVGVAVGVVVAALISMIVSLPSLRLHEDYFVVATFGFQMICFSIFNNWTSLTRGPLGIPGVPAPTLFGWSVQSRPGLLAIAVAFALLSNFVVFRLSSGAFGRALWAIREDEVFAKAMGKNTLRFKVVAFSVSAALAALAGSLFAHYMTFVDPTSFTIMESVLVISMVIIGGAGSRWGPFVGAVVLVLLPETLRFVGLPNTGAANLRQVIYGVLLVLMMIVRPRGLIGRYDWSR